MNRDFVEMLHALCDARVEFLVVGAHALAVHAQPRATGDLDLWIRPSGENAGRAYQALARFGAPLRDLTEKDLATPDQVFQIGLPPNRINLLTSISGVQFEEAWPRRVTVDIEGQAVPVIGREDLIRNKAATGRARDRADLVLLREAASSPEA
jgi:predicted nucleotidyltransferase